jgi:hypothetical protein
MKNIYRSLQKVAKYFHNGLAELVEIWHTVRFYHLRFFQFSNIVYFEDTRLT